jgi:Tfp pilus assembly protein PilV
VSGVFVAVTVFGLVAHRQQIQRCKSTCRQSQVTIIAANSAAAAATMPTAAAAAAAAVVAACAFPRVARGFAIIAATLATAVKAQNRIPIIPL